jgi:tetratricopeptide (TPR) repeat protein
MRKDKSVSLMCAAAIAVFACTCVINLPCSWAQEQSKLEKAQWLYQHENYEEALPLFQELAAQNSQSSEIAYYLGLTCKRLQDYLAAKLHLEASANLTPRVKNALPELIDVLYQCDQVEEAKKWIAVAEKESITPAQIAFFKGLVLLKEARDPDAAIKAFDDAQRLDSSLTQSIKYQKGLAYMQLKDFKEAKNYFKEVVVKEPGADLAAFANEYIDTLTRREEAARPWRASIGYSLQYDSNVVFEPDDEALSAPTAEDDDWKHVLTAQGDYNFKPNDSFGVKVGGSFYGVKNDQIGFYDVMSYDLPVQPTFYFKKATVAFPIHYNYMSVNDKKYISTTGISNLDNLMLNRDQMLQLQLQYNTKDYHWAPSTYDEKKNGYEYLWSLGWYYFFAKNRQGLVNVRYTMNKEDTEGNNWKYLGNRLSLTTVVPLTDRLKWNFVFDYYHQDFSKNNTIYRRNRHDDVFTISDLLAYELFRNAQLQVQHTYVYDSASISAYKYQKNVFGVGMKYNF